MRTPISRVRCVTPYDSTPYRPTAPRTSASTAAMLTISIVNERLAMALAARRFIVKMRYIGDVGNDVADDGANFRFELVGAGRLHDVRRRRGHGRQVHHRLRRLAAEVVDQDVLDHADDGEPLVGVGGGPDLLADRILAREQHGRRRLADDHVGRALFFLDPLEVAAAHAARSPSSGSTRRRRPRSERAALRRRSPRCAGVVMFWRAGALIQRERGDVADGLDAGDAPSGDP